MHQQFSLLKFANVVAALPPTDLSSAAVNTPWISLRNALALEFLIIKAIGTAGDDPVINLQQATDASGTGAKTLNITSLAHQTAADITASTSFTLGLNTDGDTIDRETSVASYDTDGIDGAENEQLINVRVHSEDLDEGFAFVRLQIADVGTNAQLAAVIAIALGLNYAGENKPAWNV